MYNYYCINKYNKILTAILTIEKQNMITAVTIFLCLFQIITLAKGTCDVYPVIRSPCDFQRPIVDEATCLKRLA